MARTAWVEGAGQVGTVLTRAGLWEAMSNSFLLAAAVTLLSVPVGTALALLLGRTDIPGRNLLRAGVMLPVIVPDFVLAYSWVRAYGGSGFTDDLFGIAWQTIQGPVGVAVVLAVNAVPIVFLVVSVGLAARAEPAMERAARASGAGAFTVLRSITLPLLRPALVIAAVVVFVLTLASFAIPQVMGSPAGFSTMTTRIYANLVRSSDPAAFVETVILALLLVFVAILVVAPDRPGPRQEAAGDQDRHHRSGRSLGAGTTRGWPGATAVGIYLVLAVGVPLAALVATAIDPGSGPAACPGELDDPQLRVGADGPQRGGPRPQPGPGRRGRVRGPAPGRLRCRPGTPPGSVGRIGTVVMLAFVLPGSTLAVGMLVTYGRWLGGSLLLILLAYLAKLWAFAHRPISGALDRLPPDELSAARVSGASVLVAVRTVVVRPLAPALVAAWVVCFLTALHEVTMSVLLYGPGSETLAVVVLNSSELGQVGNTAALSLLLTVMLLVPAGLCWWAVRRLEVARGVRDH